MGMMNKLVQVDLILMVVPMMIFAFLLMNFVHNIVKKLKCGVLDLMIPYPEKQLGPILTPFYDENGCDNHCPVYCSEDEELVNGEEFINWYLGYVHCKQPDYCVPLPEESKCYLATTTSGWFNSKTKVLTGSFDEFEDNSPSLCVKNCAGNGFMLAGVENGNGCYCGDDMPDESLKVSKKACNEQCPGDKDESCGGYDAMNLFEVKKFD